jgi:opacity protein-like surface antigen
MKKTLYLAAIILAVAVLPVTSFAGSIDVGAYGGYVFDAETDTGLGTPNPEGAEYGFFAHYGITVIPTTLDIAFGAFYQRSAQSFDLLGTDYDFNRNVIGLDAYAEFKLIPVIHPFARITVNVWDNVEGSNDASGTEYFQTYAVGGGIFFKLLPFISVYGEYMFTFGKDYKSNAAHAGVRFKF